MASRKFTPEERKNKAKEIALYIINENNLGHKISTRILAKKFEISNYTVSTLMRDYLKGQFPYLYDQVNKILTGNIPQTIDNIEIQVRVLEAAKLVLQVNTVKEIADKFNVSINVIYEDLQTRLKKIDSELYDKIVLIHGNNSINNLSHGNNSYVTQIRDNLGRFGSKK